MDQPAAEFLLRIPCITSENGEDCVDVPLTLQQRDELAAKPNELFWGAVLVVNYHNSKTGSDFRLDTKKPFNFLKGGSNGRNGTEQLGVPLG